MSNTQKIISTLLTITLCLALLWLLQRPQQTGTLELESALVTTSTKATTTIEITALRTAETKTWKAANLHTEVPSGDINQTAQAPFPTGAYDSIRLEIETPQIDESAAEVISAANTFELPAQTTVKANATSSVSVRVPLELSLFSTTEDARVFLPQILFESTIKKQGKTQLLEMFTFGTKIDGTAEPLFSYPQKTIFRVARDGSIQKTTASSTNKE